MILSIASGKGGTGKTLVATNLALSLEDVQFIDCDVEEPNGHLFLKPELIERISVGVPVPRIDESRCTFCGQCAGICEFNALVVGNDRTLVFDELCHGCGACSYICPEDAISEAEREIGIIERGRAGAIEAIQGVLNVGEPMAPPLIRKVKRLIDPTKTVLIDVSPGTSCPVVEAVRGSDVCLLVTEPTPFGLNDLKLAAAMLRLLEIPCGVVLNRADVGDRSVDTFCEVEGIPILMRIPLDRRIAVAYSKGIPAVEALPEYRDRFAELYRSIQVLVETSESTRAAG